MTTTIIIVVALLFLMTICILWLKIWKKEAEMRTDSFKAIERNLQELSCSMKDYIDLKISNSEINASQLTERHNIQEDGNAAAIPVRCPADEYSRSVEDEQMEGLQPYDNINNKGSTIGMEPAEETDNHTYQEYGEINLDFADEYTEESEEPIFEEPIDEVNDDIDIRTDYEIGRSGKKYTASELETLIKE